MSLKVNVFARSASLDSVKADNAVYLQYGRRRDAVAEQIIELSTDLQKSRRRMFRHDFICDLSDKRFPIRRRHRSLIRNFLAMLCS